MSNQDDDHIRVRPGTPKQRGDAFINKVLHQTNKAGAKLGETVGKVGSGPVPGWGEATLRPASLGPRSRPTPGA